LVLAVAIARLDGLYLAIATISFSEIVRILATNLDITGGPAGIVGVELTYYDHVIVGVVIVISLGLWRIARTRYGLAIDAIREDSLMAAHQGINIPLYRTMLFALSGAIAGLAGGLKVHLDGFIEPSYFNFGLLTTIVAAVVVGGLGTVLGSVVGTAILFSLPEVLRFVGTYRGVVSGVILVAVILFAPDGLVDLVARGLRWLRDLLLRRGQPVRAAGSPRGDGREELEVTRGASTTAPAHGGPAWVDDIVAESGQGSVAVAVVPEQHQEVLSVLGLTKAFGGLTALRDLTLSLHSSEVLGVIGPNGSGKTTFLNVLSGVYTPTSGSGFVLDASLERLWGRPARVAGVGLARTFQNIRLVRRASVTENVTIGAYLTYHSSFAAEFLGTPGSRAERRAVRSRVEEILDWMGLSDVADHDALSLPYGAQRRVEIARALVRGPQILMLDEPTAGMARDERDEIFAIVKRLRERGVGVIVVEHDVQSMTGSCDRLAVLDFGQMIALGSPESVMKEEVVIDAYIGRRTRA